MHSSTQYQSPPASVYADIVLWFKRNEDDMDLVDSADFPHFRVCFYSQFKPFRHLGIRARATRELARVCGGKEVQFAKVLFASWHSGELVKNLLPYESNEMYDPIFFHPGFQRLIGDRQNLEDGFEQKLGVGFW